MAKGYWSSVCVITFFSVMLINCSGFYNAATVVHITYRFIRSSRCCEHCPGIIKNVYPLCFSSLNYFFKYVLHFPSCSNLLSLNNKISSGSSCLASSSAIFFWSSAKVISRSGSLIIATCILSSLRLLASWIRLKFSSLWFYLITFLLSNSWS